MKKEYIVIVDENDNVIGNKERSLATANDLYRVSCLWITNSKGETLLAKRASGKAHEPNKWGPSAVGTVAHGESYDDAMQREIFEELGVKNIEIKRLKKIFSDSAWPHFTQCFTAKLDFPTDKFILQESEVAEIKWFEADSLEQFVKDNPDLFIKRMPKVIKNFTQ